MQPPPITDHRSPITAPALTLPADIFGDARFRRVERETHLPIQVVVGGWVAVLVVAARAGGAAPKGLAFVDAVQLAMRARWDAALKRVQAFRETGLIENERIGPEWFAGV